MSSPLDAAEWAAFMAEATCEELADLDAALGQMNGALSLCGLNPT
jgi:hypothetical protein